LKLISAYSYSLHKFDLLFSLIREKFL
jgi:hypothetical protein